MLNFETEGSGPLGCAACEQGRRRAERESENKKRVEGGRGGTRKPLYGSLNTDGHLLNITSLFPGDKKGGKKRKGESTGGKIALLDCHPYKAAAPL